MTTENHELENRAIKDAEARASALDPSQSFIVQAPAGSGKTELLMQRFLSVLATARDPSELLAITFTRKAAGEMLERVTGSLERSLAPLTGDEGPNDIKTRELAARVMERDRELGWGLLDNPAKLRVMTIDSLSAMLAGSVPLMSRTGAGFTVTDTPDELYLEAAVRTLALAEADGPTGDAVRTLMAHLDNSTAALTDRLVMMLGKRDQWLRHVTTDATDAELRQSIEGSLAVFITEELAWISSAIPEDLGDAIIGFGRFAAGNLAAEGVDSPITTLAEASGVPEATVGSLPAWRGIATLLLTSTGDVRKPGGVNKRIGFPSTRGGAEEKMKEAFKGLLGELSGDIALAHALARVSRLPDPHYSDGDWQILGALMELLPETEKLLTGVFAERGQVDFAEVAAAALRVLGTDVDPTDLLLAIDMRLTHILVDEYQDTSRTQLELLRLLTSGWTPGDGRTMFIVGDPMQSIYLFREADVGLFLDARGSGVGGVELLPLTLSSNFRSGAGIVDWVNESFVDAFPVQEDRHTGAVTYALSTAVRHEIERLDPEVRVWNERDDEREAREVADIVQAVPERESVAVLVRSRSHLADIVAELAARGIEYESVDIDPLAARPVVQDLLALTRALYNPLDRISWLAVLRAPWCGLTLSDLLGLVSGDKGTAVMGLATDWTRGGALSEDGRARLERVLPTLESALGAARRGDPAHVVESTWVTLGGPACLTDGSGMRDAEVFLDMLREATSGTAAGAAPPIDAIAERAAELYATPAPSSGRPVQLMTIHKAKGLEFDHVILPGVGRPPRRTDRELLMWVERGTELILAPVGRTGKKAGTNDVYDYVRGIFSMREELERTRLLYVAATRAVRRLSIFAYVRERETGEPRIDSGSLLQTLSHRIGEHIPIEKVDIGTDEATAGAPTGEPETAVLKRLPLSWALPEPAPSTRAAHPEPAASQREASPVFEWAGVGARHLGTVVHRYLSLLAVEGPGSWSPERVREETGSIAAQLRGLGMAASDAMRTSEEAVEMLVKTISDERGLWVLEGGGMAPSKTGARLEGAEVALTCATETGPERVVIDRTFVDSDGTRWVVDFKTGRHTGGSLDAFLESERTRYAPQLEKYAAAMRSLGETAPVRKGLYFPAFGGWVEWE